MTKDPLLREFFQSLEKARRREGDIQPVKIAQLAIEAGLNVPGALSAISDFGDRRLHQRSSGFRKRSDELADALSLFVSSICQQSKATRVLEYTVTSLLLTVHLANQPDNQQLTYITPHQPLAEAFRVLFEGRSVSIVEKLLDIPKDAEFDAIVCQPPMGMRAPSDKSTDRSAMRALVPLLAKTGTLYWLTGRREIFIAHSSNMLTDLKKAGLSPVAILDLAPGIFPGTLIEGVVVALRRDASPKKFVGTLRDFEAAAPLASAFLSGPSQKPGPNWAWLDVDDTRTFADLEHERLLENLLPRGRHKRFLLGALLTSDIIVKADKPIADDDQAASFLYVPEYASSRVTVDIEEQTVKPKAVYRLAVDRSKANPHFLARLLNSPFGNQLRRSSASGTTIPRIPAATLLSLELPIPERTIQDRITRLDSGISLLEASFREMQDTLDQDWTTLSDIETTISELEGVVDIERRIADWWRELPYPLASIYRRYQVSTAPRERLDTLLHFFEMAAVYFAAIGASHVKAMRADWQEIFAKWLHPQQAAGIERADFGFWIGLAGASLKDTKRIGSDKELRAEAEEIAGPELVQATHTIGQLGNATKVLDVARSYRNSWIGHGGHIKDSDAARLDEELQQSVRDLYGIAASVFRQCLLVRPGLAAVTDSGMKFEIENLSGSDPTFQKVEVELGRPVTTNSLAFWLSGSRTMCRAVPFFRLGVPQQPQETSFYVFNRVEDDGFRWISYQEAREQEFIAQDEELASLIMLGRKLE